jgi:hypothetical protein
MVAFDSPSREFCVAQRVQTNTPLQALVTLNDPVYVEAAQALARRMSRTPGSLEEQIRLGYRRALLRDPDAATLTRLAELQRSVAASYRADPELMRDAVTPFRPYDGVPEEGDGYAAARSLGDGDENAPEHEIFAAAPEDPVEVAALTTVATVILNLDGFLTKD